MASETWNVKVMPRARRNGVEVIAPGHLKVRLTAPPVEGAANRALLELLSDYFHVPKSHIRIVRGVKSRTKVIQIGA